MRRNLGDTVTMLVVRNNLLYLGLKEAFGEKVAELDDFLKNVHGQTALIATDMNPFKLYKQLEGTKTKSPAKGGEQAPDDVIVEEGETEFKAGPIVGDLQKVGIPAGIVSGKVVIKATKTLVKAGDVIKRELATMLTRLQIFPLTVGLDLRAALEEKTVYKSDVLAVDEGLIMSQIGSASSGAYNLAMFVAYPTSTTVPPLISKAYNQAMNLAIEAKVMNKDSVGPILAKAVAQAISLRARIEGTPAPAPAAPSAEEPTEKKDDDKKDTEEDKAAAEADAAEGLGSLFGD
jgi:large subunit ribosomal protein L10